MTWPKVVKMFLMKPANWRFIDTSLIMCVDKIIFWSRRIQISRDVGSVGKLLGSKLEKAVADPDIKIMSSLVKIVPFEFIDNSSFSSRMLSCRDEICN